MNQIKNFFNRFYSSLLLFFKNLFRKENTSKIKQKARRFEEKTHDGFDQVRATTRKHRKKGTFSGILNKGLFGFNIVYGVLRTTLFTLVIILGLFGILGLGTGMGYFAALVSNETPPTEDEMAQAIGDVELISTLHYNSGDLISEVRTDLQRTVIGRDQINSYVIDGLVSTEDEYFYEHDGVVPKAVLRALLTEVTGLGETTGGSTLTQQLIKQQLLTNEVTFSRKVNEILLALRLENYYDKEEIITAYLNVSPFGRNSSGANIAGIEEAAQGVFGVSASEVTLPQAAFLVGLPQNPYVYTPYTNYGEQKEDFSAGIARMQTVLTRMFEEQKISEDEYKTAINHDIAQDFITEQDEQLNRHNFLYQQVEKQSIEILMTLEAEKNGLTYEDLNADVDLYNEYYFRNEGILNSSGYKVHTTVDKNIYQAMQEAVNEFGENLGPTYTDIWVDPETGEELEITELAQSGSMLLENETGRILGFIGGRDFSIDQNDHAFDTPRSPGSTIKPLAVYAPAIEMNVITPTSMLPDSKFGDEAIDNETGQPWEASNIGGVISNTLVPARRALYQSMNNPTGKVYVEMLNNGMEPYQFMEKMGYHNLDTKTLSAFSLGAASTTVKEQTTGFATFANQGNFVESYIIEKIEDNNGNVIYQHETETREVFTPQTAYITLDILRDVIDLGFSNQINGFLNFDADLAAKTGTSQDNEDYWFIASTPTVTMSSWVGYNNFVQKHTFYDPNATGAPSVNNMRYWALIANKIHETNPEVFGIEQTHTRPEGIIEREVLKDTGTLAGQVKIPGSDKTIKIDSKDKTTDLFKADNPPKAITYNFAPGANDKDLKDLFWDEFTKKAEEEEKKKKDEEEKKKKEEVEKKKEQEAKEKAEKEKAEKEKAEKEKAEKEKKEKEEAEKKKDDANSANN